MKEIIKEIIVPRVGINLLRKQRNRLLKLQEVTTGKADIDIYEGVINLLDSMLDIAEGFPVISNTPTIDKDININDIRSS